MCKKGKNYKGYKRFLKNSLIVCILTGLIYTIINRYIIFSISVPTKSMYPTIDVNDKIFVLRINDFSNIRRGDIIVFWSKELNTTFVKRVIGLPNDQIVIDRDGNITINNENLKEVYATYKGDKLREYAVPPNNYFFLGDNLADSFDSRYWNNPFIEEEHMLGKLWIRYYPIEKFGKVDK